MTKIRTWKEQQDAEREMRRAWLQQLVDLGGTAADAARRAGIRNGQMLKLLRQCGVEPQQYGSTADRSRRSAVARAAAHRPGRVGRPKAKVVQKPKTLLELMVLTAARENGAVRAKQGGTMV